ncbi:hypothetical protein [Yinghuangia sp. YIM S10712]|uniref:hypothetical protein n=1 Tax=Yinghuangia sp. YIM S10712 TaxID=3436930 RepID=UPI003F5361F0
MIILGLLIAAACAAFVALLIAYNTSGGPEYTVRIFDRDMVTLDSLAIFVSGVALALLFCLGLALAMAALRAHRRARRRHYATVPGDAALRGRSAQPEGAGEWQADPTVRPQGAETPRPRHGSTDFPGGSPPQGRGG